MKPRFSTLEHVETGHAIKYQIRSLHQLSVKVGNAYPLTTKALRRINRAGVLLNEARQFLQGEMGKESMDEQGQDDFDKWPVLYTRVYFGQTDEDLSAEETLKLISHTDRSQ